MSEENYKITITGQSSRFEKDITKAMADEIAIWVLSNNRPSNSPEEAEQVPTTNKKSHSRKIKSPSSKKFPTKIQIRDEIKNFTPDPTSPLYGNYWDLKTQGEKILWLLALARDAGIDNLYQKEITALSEKVSDFIETKKITPLIASQKRHSRIVISPNDKGYKTLRILQPGIDYLKTKHGEVSKKPKGLVLQTG